MSRIYVASSWKCERQPEIVKILRSMKHEVYDFRNPGPNDNGFGWSDCPGGALPFERWDIHHLRAVLSTSRAEAGYRNDKDALDWAEATILVLPCGRSAHLELGYAIGRGQKAAVLIGGETMVPELMYKMAGIISDDIKEIEEFVSRK